MAIEIDPLLRKLADQYIKLACLYIQDTRLEKLDIAAARQGLMVVLREEGLAE